MPAETNPSRGILDELAERLENFHDSARAPASCPQNHDVSRRTDQSVIEAAKCMCHKLLGEASDDLERHAKVSLPRPHGTNVDVFVPRRRVRSLWGKRQHVVRRWQCRFHRHSQIVQEFAVSKTLSRAGCRFSQTT